MIYRDPAHYLKPLRSNTIPQRWLWLDCHGQGSKEAGLYVDRFHVGALGRTWHTSRRRERQDQIDTYDDPQLLWQAAADYCKPGRRVVLFASDLAYQLRISQALVWMPRLGWRLEKIVLEKTAAWCSLRSGNRSLLCCDLSSWAPVELDVIRADLVTFGLVPSCHDAGPDFRHQVCKARVATVREAVLQIAAWLSAENLGPFRPTGSGQSYAAFRRRFLHHNVLVHDDVGRLERERAAMWTGRCEAWRHGQLHDGPFAEYDMRAAYCQIAATHQLPAIAAGVMDKPSTSRLLDAAEKDCVLAELEITTDVPVVPAGLAGRTLWPTGTFRTLLWDPEWQLALDYAADVKCTRAWRYRPAPALADFARFALEGLGEQLSVYGPIPARVLKHWSRCLVGRLGLRYRRWQRFGTSPTPDLRLVTYIDTDEGVSTDLLCAGFERLILAEMTEALESVPQIPGYVMSVCRAQLWQAMLAVGLQNVIYLDTDSIIVKADELVSTAAILDNATGGVWAHKGEYRSLTIHGPRNLACETTRRVAGVPLRARQTAPLEFTGQVMRSIKESMRAGELDCVASIPRTFRLDAPDLRRRHLPRGATAPYRLEPDAATRL